MKRYLLAAFVNEVQEFIRAGTRSAEQGQPLIAAAPRFLAALGG